MQSNTLRILETILDDAVNNGNREQSAAIVLLQVMKLANEPKNIVDFYEVLNKAEEDARKLKKNPKIDRYIQVIEELQQLFVVNHIWNTKWKIFADYIENKNVLTTLDALANYLHSQNPTVFLDQDFLKKLNIEFDSLLNQVLNSDLSKELKGHLIEKIEDILKALRRYSIDGTEGLEKSAKSLVTDLVITENTLKDEEQKNFVYIKLKAFILSLVLFLKPTSPYDIVGTVPDIYEFWVPKFEELVNGREKIEKIVDDESNIQLIFEKALAIFNRESRKMISGKEQKALPASKENIIENNVNNKANP